MSGSSLHAAVVTAALLLAPALAHADAPVMSGRAHVEQTHVSALLSLTSFGAGVLVRLDNPEDATPGHPTALNAELTFAPIDGVIELRAARAWQLTRPSLFALTAQLGVSSYTIVKGPIDFGAGPQAALIAGLGGDRFAGYLGAQAGVEAFFRSAGPRVPLRALLGVRARFTPLVASLTLKGGVDYDSGYHLTYRGDAVLEVGWSGPVAALGAP